MSIARMCRRLGCWQNRGESDLERAGLTGQGEDIRAEARSAEHGPGEGIEFRISPQKWVFNQGDTPLRRTPREPAPDAPLGCKAGYFGAFITLPSPVPKLSFAQ